MPIHASVKNLSSHIDHSSRERTLLNALQLFSYIRKIGLIGHELVGNLLVPMWIDVDELLCAQEVFDKLVVKSECSWCCLINAYIKHGDPSHAFTLYEAMTKKSLQPNDSTFVALLNACSRLKDIKRGNELYADIAGKGLMVSNQFIGNALIDMYAKCGLVDKAQEVFDMLPARDVVTWTALIAGYAHHSYCEKALEYYQEMQSNGIHPNAVTYTCALKACGGIAALDKGKEIHSQVCREGLLKRNNIIGNALVDMYIKCGLLTKAQDVFDGLAVRDVVAWNTLISGFVHHDLNDKALLCFEQMQFEGVPADAVTFTCVLKACAITGALSLGREVHSQVRRTAFLKTNQFVCNALVDMYAKCGDLREAQKVFDALPVHHLVAWNALIAGYVENDRGGEALQCLRQMQYEGTSPDAITAIYAMKAYGSIEAYAQAIDVHKHFEEKGLFKGDPSLGSQLVDMYAKWGFMDRALEQFDKLLIRDKVAWTALIAGYTQHNYDEEALLCYEQMQLNGNLPDSVTFACCLKVCGSLVLLDKGQEIHAEIARNNMIEVDNYLLGALVDMYAKCGLLIQAQEMFESSPLHDIILWTALVTAYAQQGDLEMVLRVFNNMIETTSPNSITFVSILNACSHAGLTESGQKYFEVMTRDYGIFPSFEHYTCIIDLFGRAGQLDKAAIAILQAPFYDDIVMWRTLMGACRKWQDVELARKAYEHAIQLDDDEVASHISLYNIYADVGLVRDAEYMLN
ncbi:hypothetical protein KP509_29G081800 [Ceratopteris richardii]|uniref:Pentatricopeptide repeat-containing protein n=1 Tax=Ceratopteris richardii TaxID=49495 RepID=A0A8T2R8G4_CERRI|nr:hypothetical protein KP509_29G081800 [Ceratopteris richardii]